jgi:hypothetical protein
MLFPAQRKILSTLCIFLDPFVRLGHLGQHHFLRWRIPSEQFPRCGIFLHVKSRSLEASYSIILAYLKAEGVPCRLDVPLFPPYLSLSPPQCKEEQGCINENTQMCVARRFRRSYCPFCPYIGVLLRTRDTARALLMLRGTSLQKTREMPC